MASVTETHLLLSNTETAQRAVATQKIQISAEIITTDWLHVGVKIAERTENAGIEVCAEKWC